MWRVMIADDEPKIRRGLRTAIEHIRPDMKVVAEAEDGEMALDAVRREKPDILMVDVRMPFLNGLELIERIRDVQDDCVIIVVSGHDEFEYARRALQMNVFDYLLKPVPQDVLAGVLARAVESLAAARRQRQYINWAREQLDRNLPILREQFLRDWIRGRLSAAEIAEQGEFLGVRTTGPASLALIHVAERAVTAPASAERERRLGLFAVRSAVAEIFARFSPLQIFGDDRDNIIALAGCAGGDAWVEVAANVEAWVVPSLCQGVIVTSTAVPDAAAGLSEAYEALAAEVAARGTHRSLVIAAQGYIDTHLAQPSLSLEEVATAVKISPGYLSRLLKMETGFSFVDYLTRVRVSRAVQLMGDPSVKVYEVAEAVGYQSQHYFSRAFKRVFGRPPVEFRRGGA